MTASKELFLRDKALSAWWAGVVNHDNFSKVMLHVRSSLMDEGNPNLTAAMAFERAMRDIPFGESKPKPFPTPGLKHDLDNPRGEIDHSATDTKPKQA